MAEPAIYVRGLREFRSELRRIDRSGGTAWARELGAAHRDVGKLVAGKAQGKARAMGGPQAHFADRVRGRGTQANARVSVASVANASFWGAKKRTGWNARNPDSRPQHPHWIGTSWQPGGPGGPYAINPAIKENLPMILTAYRGAVDRVARRAFPD